jgi:hypothetical protein
MSELGHDPKNSGRAIGSASPRVSGHRADMPSRQLRARSRLLGVTIEPERIDFASVVLKMWAAL